MSAYRMVALALGTWTVIAGLAWAESDRPIDRETLDRWSAPYRGWHYWPEPVIPSMPNIPGHETFRNTDAPCVYQLPGQPDRWYMSFVAFDGHGYNSFVAESDDLVHWKSPRLAMGFGKPGQFDHGGCVVGAYLYESYDIRAPRTLKRRDGKFWTLYGCYPRQGGYELRPGYEGVAVSDDGLAWHRAKDQPILAVSDADCGAWERSCVYQPWLLTQDGRFYDFYNAAQDGVEQTGLALSTDLLNWKRYAGNPVVRVRPKGYDERFASDPKVFRDGDHWTMIYFGVGRGGAHIMAAFSRNLLHWTAHPEPLYKAGGHPAGLDKTYAHKISLVYHPKTETFYMYYCAVGTKGRCIGLLTSRCDPGKAGRDGAAACGAGEIEPAGLTRVVAVERACAWPNLTRMRDGTIAAIIHNQPTHGKQEGDVDCWASADGLKWEKRGTAAAHEPNTVRMNVAAGLAKNGDLVVLSSGWTNEQQPRRPKQAPFRDAPLRSWVCRSADGGRTWHRRTDFPLPPDGQGQYIPFGDIWASDDGSLRASCYQGGRAWCFRSDDDGQTWRPMAVIGPQHNETDLLPLGGRRWLAAARIDAVELFRSDDGGRTWQGPQRVTHRDEVNGHLLKLNDGRLLLSYGVRIKGIQGVCAKLSADEGRTWGPPIRLARSLHSDCGYPSSVQRADGTIVTAYYSKNAPEYDNYHMGVAVWSVPPR